MTAFDLSGIVQAPVVPSSTGCAAWTNIQDSSTDSKDYAIERISSRNVYLPHTHRNDIYQAHHAFGQRKQHRSRFAVYNEGWTRKRERKYFVTEEIKQEALQLWRKFMNVPRYYTYRNRKPKKDKEKWPDDAEWAFWIGKLYTCFSYS